jgi:hypothetical protein
VPERASVPLPSGEDDATLVRLDAFLDWLVGGQPQLAVLAGERQWTCDARLGHLGS